MKNIKSHFWYTKSQRNGVLFLIIIIILTQLAYIYINFIEKDPIQISSFEVIAIEKEIDSLRKEKKKKKEYKPTFFNPNYISDYKGYKLGMSLEEIDRLHLFRSKQKFVNSKKEFQEITKVSDSLLNKIAPYFKFPDWVKNKIKYKGNLITKKISKVSTTDINKVTQQDLMIIKGVSLKLSNTIIKYRSKLKGFSYQYQLKEVWGMNESLYIEISKILKIHKKPNINKVNINTATFKEVLKLPYINYELCKSIFNYRDEVAELQKISELRNIKDFPQNKYDRIVLYLKAN